MLIKRNIVALFAFSFMASATAAEFSIGGGAVYNESPYVDIMIMFMQYRLSVMKVNHFILGKQR